MSRRARWFLGGLLIFVAIAAVALAPLREWHQQQRTEAALAAADAHLQAGRIEQAFLAYQTLAEDRPHEPRARDGVTRTYAAAGGTGATSFWPGALERSTAAVSAALQRRDYAAARQVAGRALAEYPGTMFGHWLAGVVAFAEGAYDPAEQHLDAALRLAPHSHRVITNLAGVWSRRDGPESAARRLEDMARDGFAYPLDIAATAWLEARQPARAEAALRRGLALEPDSADPYVELTDFYVELDRPGDAVAVLIEALDRFPEDARLSKLRDELAAEYGGRPQ